VTVPGVARTGSAVERLGVRVDGDAAALLGLALRRNPRRAQLLVSRVLGKHVPTDPRLVRAAGLVLGGLVADVLADRSTRPLPVELLHAAVAGDPVAAMRLHGSAERAVEPVPRDALVLGFAETATALGHCVAEALGGADYLHSTRRPAPHLPIAGGFTEDHSHATEHLLVPADPGVLRGGRPLVLVDDELSTGRTALNTITALHRLAPRARYVVAALIDVRPEQHSPRSAEPAGATTLGIGTRGARATGVLAAGVQALGARLDVVALARGHVVLPPDLAARATSLRADHGELGSAGAAEDSAGQVPPRWVELRELGWPQGLPVGGRHGFRAGDHARLAAALSGLARGLGVRSAERTLVLGTEELMALPLRLAQTLADAGHDVAFSTTTRSPAIVVDQPDYALRSGITFPAHDDPADGPGPRYAYNLGGSAEPPWDHVLVVVDPPAATPLLHTGLLAELAPHARRVTVVVTP
jgi:adenine/guanine phosphoribosyltransferase-like PRPP-binding protein